MAGFFGGFEGTTAGLGLLMSGGRHLGGTLKTKGGDVKHGTDEFNKLAKEFVKQTGMNPIDSFSTDRETGGFAKAINPAFRMFASGFSGFGGATGEKAEAAATPGTTAPGDPNNMQAAAERQDAAAAALDGMDDPIVAGRREALLMRRGKGKGLASLSRGFASRNLLATTPLN